MGVFRVVGDAIVKEKDYSEVVDSEAFKRLASKRKQKPSQTVGIGDKQVLVKDVVAPTAPAGHGFQDTDTGLPFLDIGPGKPLTIKIEWVYTGGRRSRHPKDMLITSAFKPMVSAQPAARAVNLIRKKVHRQTNIQWTALDKGTPLSYYSPAMLDETTYATFELAFDTFPDQIINKIGDLTAQAAGIPLFVAQSTYLIAAGSVLKLAAKIGNKIFAGRATATFSEPIILHRAGHEPTKKGWLILTRQGSNDGYLKKLKVGKKGQLLWPNGTPYGGIFPYIVISLDGRKKDSYKDFTPTATSSAMLEQFFGVSEGESKAVDDVLEGLRLYSDYKFRLQAEEAKKALDRLPPDSEEYRKKEKELKALKANINLDEFKLS